MSWNKVKERLLARFSREKLRGPSQPFFAVKQTGKISQYIHMFEDLSTHVSGLTDRQLEGIFMNGLTPEMREVVNMSKQVDLPEMIATVYQMEDNAFYKMVCREINQEGRVGMGQKKFKPVAQSCTSSDWQSKQQAKKTGTQDKGGGNRVQRPQLWLSDSQIVEKKRLGQCFTSDDKWSRQHWCPNRYLQVLTVVNGIGMEIVDQSLIEIEEDTEISESTLMALSLSSFMEIS